MDNTVKCPHCGKQMKKISNVLRANFPTVFELLEKLDSDDNVIELSKLQSQLDQAVEQVKEWCKCFELNHAAKMIKDVCEGKYYIEKDLQQQYNVYFKSRDWLKEQGLEE